MSYNVGGPKKQNNGGAYAKLGSRDIENSRADPLLDGDYKRTI